jgi:hypothetical protein
VAQGREVHLPDVPDPNCTENVEPSKISTARATGRPLWTCATENWFAGVQDAAGADDIVPVLGQAGDDHLAVLVARPPDPPTRHRPGDDRGERPALPRFQRSRIAGRRAVQAVSKLSDQYHRIPVVVVVNT